jgi:hypothetical protein
VPGRAGVVDVGGHFGQGRHRRPAGWRLASDLQRTHRAIGPGGQQGEVVGPVDPDYPRGEARPEAAGCAEPKRERHLALRGPDPGAEDPGLLADEMGGLRRRQVGDAVGRGHEQPPAVDAEREADRLPRDDQGRRVEPFEEQAAPRPVQGGEPLDLREIGPDPGRQLARPRRAALQDLEGLAQQVPRDRELPARLLEAGQHDLEERDIGVGFPLRLPREADRLPDLRHRVLEAAR